ncbi:hypothetical protein KCQ_17257 [Pectobacterium atrosepticum ICMP 1526]|nr:hypothetical protein KCQ_17257 [Pectobacterium atrosepticum ICMP 1526]
MPPLLADNAITRHARTGVDAYYDCHGATIVIVPLRRFAYVGSCFYFASPTCHYSSSATSSEISPLW